MTQPALFTPTIPTPAAPAVDRAEQPTLHELVRTTATNTRGRNAKAGRCRTCRQPILRGLDEDLCALQVDTDPTPLTRLGEAMALLADRKTYDLANHAGHWQLTRRGRWRIAATNTRSLTDTVPAHRCHDDTLRALTTDTVHAAPSAALAATDQPPY